MNTDRRARLRELLCAADDAVSQRRKIARMIADCEEMTTASPLLAYLAAAVAREAAATAALPGAAVAAECGADGAPSSPEARQAEPPAKAAEKAGDCVLGRLARPGAAGELLDRLTSDDLVDAEPPAENPRPNPAAASADASATASISADSAAPPTPEPPARKPRQRRKKGGLDTSVTAAVDAVALEDAKQQQMASPVPVWPVKGGYAFGDPAGIDLAASCGVGATFAADEFVDVADRLLAAGRELLVVEPLDAPPRADAPADLLFDPAEYALRPTAHSGGL